MTVADFAARWSTLCPRPNPATTEHNDSRLKRWVTMFGDRELDGGVSPLEAQEFCLADPRNLSSARYVRVFYNDAVKLKLAYSNPIAEMALVLRPGEGRREVVPPTLEDVRAIAARAKDAKFAAAILLSVATGIRQGELCALEVSMVQRVPYTLIRLPASIVKGSAGKKRERLLTFPVETPDAERAFLSILPESGPVFGWTPATLRTRWSELRKTVGFEWNWHSLRHAAATWLLESGRRPEDLALALWGHRDPTLLYTLYGHENREAAAERLRAGGHHG